MPYILLGLSLGLSAGLAPGPLFALVIQRTLRYGKASGLRIATAPLLTDLPIVLLALLVISRLPAAWLHGMMAAGGLFVLWLAQEAWRETGDVLNEKPTAPSARQDFLRGMMVNFLNPHPYLFWATVGAPLIFQAWRQKFWYAAGFLISFYLLLVGSKVVLALAVSNTHRLSTQFYHRLMRFSAILLFGAGLYMLYAAGRGWGVF